jgi:hypothetical protein
MGSRRERACAVTSGAAYRLPTRRIAEEFIRNDEIWACCYIARKPYSHKLPRPPHAINISNWINSRAAGYCAKVVGAVAPRPATLFVLV